MNQKALPKVIADEILKLIFTDVRRLELLLQIAIFIVRTPVDLILVASIMWFMMGPQRLLGLVFMISIIPLESRLANISENLKIKVLSHSGQRLTVTREVLSHMHEVKLNTWESPLHSIVCEYRR